MYFAISNEKREGDEEIIRSHLEDIILDMKMGIVVSDYSIVRDGDYLEAYLEPFRYIDHPLDYYIKLDDKSKRKIDWISVSEGWFSSAYITPKGIIRSILGGKCTKLHVRSQKKLKDE